MRDLRRTLAISDDVHQRMMEEIKLDAGVQALQAGRAPTARAPAAAAAAAAAAPPALPPKPGPGGDPHSIVGLRVTITQEDDSTVEVVVTGYDALTREHLVVPSEDFPGGGSEPLPLMDHPEAYEIVGCEPSLYRPPAAAAPAPAPAPAAPKPAPKPRPAGGGGGGGGYGGGERPAPSAARRPGGGGGGGGGARSTPKVRPPRPSGGGGGSKSSLPKQQPPYDASYLAARLAVAQPRELGNLLAALARKEQQVLSQLEGVATVTQDVRDGVARRAALVSQLQQAMASGR